MSFIFFSLLTSANAQENINSIDSLNIHQNIENINSNFNLNNAAMIQQVGSFNEANINQAGNSGILPNVAEINQQGYNNFASSNQNGNSNLTLIGQRGSDNSADINVLGNRNLAGVLQVGNGNTVSQDLMGDDLHFLIFQNRQRQFDKPGSDTAYINSNPDPSKWQWNEINDYKRGNSLSAFEYRKVLWSVYCGSYSFYCF